MSVTDKFLSYIKISSPSDENCETKTPGFFVAGDCRRKKVRQLTTAVADGTVAATAACEYLDQLH